MRGIVHVHFHMLSLLEYKETVISSSDAMEVGQPQKGWDQQNGQLTTNGD